MFVSTPSKYLKYMVEVIKYDTLYELKQSASKVSPINLFNNMITTLLFFLLPVVLCDAPEPWQLGFQDGASPSYEGITELHDYILFYLIIILQGVGVILSSVVLNWNAQVNKIVHKYHNHGHKCQRLSQPKRSFGHPSEVLVHDEGLRFTSMPKGFGYANKTNTTQIPWVRLKLLPSQDQL